MDLFSIEKLQLAEASLCVIVAPVNDQPSVISPSFTIEIDEDSGRTVIPGVYVTDPDAHEKPDHTMKVPLATLLLNHSTVSALS